MPNSRWPAALMIATLAASPIIAADAPWKPEKNIEIIIAAAAAGANDRIGRSIQRVLQDTKLVPTPVAVVNKPGGGQNIAAAYLNSHPGDPHYLMLASASWFTTVAGGRGNVSYRDLTPIIKMYDEYQVYYVQAESPIKTGKDLGERLKKDVTSLSFAFSTALGNPLHISIANIARAVGADPLKLKTVVYNSGALASSQVAGGHLDVGVSSPGSAGPLTQSGKLRIFAIAGPKRLGPPFTDVPTLREQGIDVIAPIFYVILAPKGISAAQLAFWEDALLKVTQSPEIRKDIDSNHWTVEPIVGRDLGAYLDRQHENMRRTLLELGLAK
jgi:putative tricarboxylic transport membrane protein